MVFEYKKCCEIDDTYNSVSSVMFKTLRFDRPNHIIYFDTPVTPLRAVLAVERYLSLSMDEDYFYMFREKTFYSKEDWYNVRNEEGFCLGRFLLSEKYLEGYSVDKKGQMVLQIGT